MKRTLAVLVTLFLVIGTISLAYAAAGCTHTWSDVIADQKPTCTEPGIGHRTCTKCGETQHRIEIPALGHKYSKWEIEKEPTCTEEGEEIRRCSRCGRKWSRAISPLGHEWGEWYVVTEPTPAAPGIERRDCVREDISEEREIPWEGGMPQLQLTVVQPASLSYVPGQLITFPFTLTNVGDWECVYYYTVARYDKLDNSTLWVTDRFKYASDIQSGDALLEAGGGSASGEFMVVLPDVTDLDEITLVFTGYANADEREVDDPDYRSNMVYITFTREKKEPVLEVHKQVTSDPDECGLYHPGDVVTFAITVVNPTDEAIEDFYVHDALYHGEDGSKLAYISELPAHGSQTFEFAYTVTEQDALIGYVYNEACAKLNREDSAQQLVFYSNYVMVFVDEKEIQMPTIVKKEISTPGADGFYHEGEEIRYEIVITNPTEEDMRFCEVYDVLNNGAGVLVGKIDKLEPHTSYTYSFAHTVDAQDVVNGWVENFAYITYVDGMRNERAHTSNTVYSPTNGGVMPPDHPNPPVLKGGKDRPCELTLISVCGEGAFAEQYICTEHMDTASRACAAKTTAEVQAIWTEAIDELYEICLQGCSDPADYEAVLNDKLAFYAYVNTRIDVMTEAGASDEEIAVEVNEMMLRRCTEMCNIVYTAPSARKDLYANAVPTTVDVSELCTSEVYYWEGDTQQIMIVRCAKHSKVEHTIEGMLAECGDGHTVDVWQKASRLWNNELGMLQSADSAEAVQFRAMVSTRAKFLAFYYDGATVSEMTATMIRNRVSELCK